MRVKIGTFNLNNLFGRFNFKASIEGIQEGGVYSFNAQDRYWIRKFFGKLVKPKDEKETKCLADKILKSRVDVLAVQEVEDRDTLKRFNKEYLSKKYPHQVVVDANDPRLMDVGILSKFPIGSITSWQHYPDPDNPNKPVFSRDLLQVEVLDPKTCKLLFTFFITHNKSKFIPYWSQSENTDKQTKKNDVKRFKQSKAIVDIVTTEMGRDNRFVISGDLNDIPESECLAPLLKGKLGLENVINRLPKEDRWTYVYEGEKQQLDYLLLPPLLQGKAREVEISRTGQTEKRGSDHDPVFMLLNL